MSMSNTQTATAYEQRPPPATRPRSKSHLSFKSERSHKSTNSTEKKQKLTESPREKRKSSFTKTGKANPNAAINEAQPIALALEAPTIAPLRGIQHKDAAGNSIVDPDLSNPTRPRWERPLDTIKSFDDAIDREYRRRSMVRNDSAPDGGSDLHSRRSSYIGGNGYDNARGSQIGGFYGSRSAVGRDRDSILGNAYGGPPIAHPSRNRYGQRMHSDPVVPRHNHEGAPIYPTQGYQQSRDTVHTGGSGSGSEPWANGTDPSSEESSIHRHTPGDLSDPRSNYGYNGLNSNIPEDHMAEPPYQSRRPEAAQQPPMPPQHRQPMGNGPPPAPPKQSYGGPPAQYAGSNQYPQPLNQTVSNTQRPATLTKNTSNTSNGDKGDKRKSWFKRRFSKD